MAEPSQEAREFMGRFFAMGPKSSVTSHAPHETLSRMQAAFDECKALGLVTVTAFNSHGSITIRPTDNGLVIANAAFAQSARALMGGTHV